MGCAIDHIIFAVRDLDASAAAYSALLGRAASWRGEHPEYGSQNCLFRLDNIYIELMAASSVPQNTGQSDDLKRAGLAQIINSHIDSHGESLFGLVFGHDDLAALKAHLAQFDIGLSDAEAGYGVDINSGARRDWQNAGWNREAARGIFSFAITHDADSVLPPSPITCDSPMIRTDHLVLQTRDGDAAVRFYGDALGLRLALRQMRKKWGGEMLFFRSNQMSLEVIASPDAPEQDTLWGIAYVVDDLAAAHTRLVEGDIAVSAIRDGRKPQTRVATVKSHHLGVPTLLIEHL